MKINQHHYSPIQPTQTSSATKEIGETKSTAPLRSSPVAAIDPVLGDAQKALQNLPEIDMARVAEMKQALSNGQLHVNLDDLTLSIQKYFQR
ncbi:flagellar biosynthesis anti-sigma factor FlgM [Buttiauxella warmboldiae]|uniref:Negative regulator of flagellin synthesis n=1 Tax=Buttiauxella warmboldiae TaxID=82993 RepID=A0A3N5EAQ2_9ENTR|nr:flagellar biosynthesis anti-sigma factor FlgM [Buttiauxella warmboldiae]RPH29453.1 flagellar biosynthesis anti-sigma factor FlgM [Buttiauxella warmboldiae]